MGPLPDQSPGMASHASLTPYAAARRALWIRHTRHRHGGGAESVALWCAVFDSDLGRPPGMVKQVFTDFPPGTAAGPGRFRGQAAMGEHAARWDLAIASEEPPLRPLLPAALYRSPLPRTKLEASVPDGQVTGMLEADGRSVSVSGWRGTAGHNWGTEHADSWVWLHAAGFGGAPEAWLDLVLARIRVGPARSPWTAMGALSLDGERIVLGGLGRQPAVSARPGLLTGAIPGPGGRLRLSVTAGDDATNARPAPRTQDYRVARPELGEAVPPHAAAIRCVPARRFHGSMLVVSIRRARCQGRR